MGASDGPVFAPPRPGSNPITAPPCPCRECTAGPGIDFEAARHRRYSTSIRDILRAAGVETVEQKFCRSCSKIVWTIVVDMGDHRSNVCEPEGHTWRS